MTLHLTVQLKITFGSAFEETTEGSSEGIPKGVLWDLYKDTQEGAFQEGSFEAEIKRALEVAIELDMMMHLLWCKGAQND